MIAPVLQVLLIVLFPACAIWITKQLKIAQWLSPVMLCYGIGILVSNTALLLLDKSISNTFSEVSILFAIPLLLFSTDIVAWLKQATTTVLSFSLCVASGIIVTALVAWQFAEQLPNAWRYSGMMLGLFTGGAPNMQAVGLMLNATEEEILLVSTADIFCGGIYLMFLTSVAHRFFGLFLRPYLFSSSNHAPNIIKHAKITLVAVLTALGLALLAIALSLAITWLITSEVQSIVLILLLLTSIAIGLSFSPKVRQLPNTFEIGEYFLLMFCVALGLLADFSTIWEKGGTVIYYMTCVWLGIASLHALLAYLFRIDRDTYLITSTAAIYGPIFVGQVATAIGNRELLFSGMATGLVGYAIGNYLGYGMGQFLYAWLG